MSGTIVLKLYIPSLLWEWYQNVLNNVLDLNVSIQPSFNKNQKWTRFETYGLVTKFVRGEFILEDVTIHVAYTNNYHLRESSGDSKHWILKYPPHPATKLCYSADSIDR